MRSLLLRVFLVKKRVGGWVGGSAPWPPCCPHPGTPSPSPWEGEGDGSRERGRLLVAGVPRLNGETVVVGGGTSAIGGW